MTRNRRRVPLNALSVSHTSAALTKARACGFGILLSWSHAPYSLCLYCKRSLFYLHFDLWRRSLLELQETKVTGDAFVASTAV